MFNLNMYLELERQRKEGREKRLVEQAKPEEERKKEAMLFESEHIHNKALFDCVNASLHQFRYFCARATLPPAGRTRRRASRCRGRRSSGGCR